MNRTHATIRLAAGLGIGIALASTQQATFADVSGAYSSGTQYTVKVTHMPDFDQRRGTGPGLLALPNNGNYYCVPTSSINMFAYAANHGFPNMPPGPAWWQSQAKYNDAGTHILLLGSLMFTDPFDGTTSGNAEFGGSIMCNSNLLTYTAYYASGNSSPTINHAASALLNGGIVSICYGRYLYLGASGNTVFIGPRDGGHCVTLTQATRSGNELLIKVRDPADEPDKDTNPNWLTTQSPFSDKVFNSARQVTATSIAPSFTRTMSLLINPPGTTARLIDSIFVVKPMFGLTWQPGINNNPPKIKFRFPQRLAGGMINADILIDIIGMSTANDIVISQATSQAFALGTSAAGGPLLKMVDTNTGETVDIAPIPGGKKLVLGRKGGLYVLTDEAVYCLSTNPDDFDDPVTAQVFPPGPCTAMEYDDGRDELILLCPSQHKIFRYPANLPAGAGPQVTCIPENIILAGDGSVHVNPVDGKEWFITDGTSSIYHVPFDPTCEPDVQMISFGEIARPRSISFDDNGHMYVACDAGLKELMFNTKLDRWELLANGYFEDFTPGPRFEVTRSRTNFDPAIHTPEQWYNVDPAEEQDLDTTDVQVDCLADIVDSDTFAPPGDGKVDGADLAYLLGQWGPQAISEADFVTSATFIPPDDGIVDGADLAYLLGAWGDCP